MEGKPYGDERDQNLSPSKLLLQGRQQMLADLLLVWAPLYVDSHKTRSHVKVICLKGFSKGEFRPGEEGQRWGLTEQGAAWGGVSGCHSGDESPCPGLAVPLGPLVLGDCFRDRTSLKRLCMLILAALWESDGRKAARELVPGRMKVVSELDVTSGSLVPPGMRDF